MSSAAIYLGVDGGGTKTEFVCIDNTGEEIARSLTGATYHLEVGFDEVIERLRRGVEDICTVIGILPDGLNHVFFGLPAYGEDKLVDQRLHTACGKILGHARYRCGNDMVSGWAGSLACEDGINIVAGTGSIGYGEHGNRTARVGGWGEVFSDEGSAYWIAKQGLAAFSRMSDGRIAKGPLHDFFRKALSLKKDIDLCQRIMGPPLMSRGQIAALAPLVSAAAEGESDVAALAILDCAAKHLCDIALALRERLEFPEEARIPLSWSGSILTEATMVRRRFIDLLKSAGRFKIVDPLYPPGYGAALYARRVPQRAQIG